MLYKLKTNASKNYEKNIKNSLSPPRNIKGGEIIDYNTQTPLYKMLMDNTKIKKINLIRNSVTISKEEIILKTTIIIMFFIIHN